jgi:hypothetical protein
MRHTRFVVDVETDGPAPGLYSMVWLGIVRLDAKLVTTFESKLRPISEHFIPEALAVSGLTRTETLKFLDPQSEMEHLVKWLNDHTYKGTTPELWSDNNGFDAAFLNYYLWRYVGHNPFGHSSRNISDRYQGFKSQRFAGQRLPRSFQSLRRTLHDHNPVNDARGNAEALLAMQKLGCTL